MLDSSWFEEIMNLNCLSDNKYYFVGSIYCANNLFKYADSCHEILKVFTLMNKQAKQSRYHNTLIYLFRYNCL